MIKSDRAFSDRSRQMAEAILLIHEKHGLRILHGSEAEYTLVDAAVAAAKYVKEVSDREERRHAERPDVSFLWQTIPDLQESVHRFHVQFRGSAVPPTEMGCVLGEEAGEVQRILCKRATGDRPEIWNTLGAELADVVLVCLAIAGREGIDLDAELTRKLKDNWSKAPLKVAEILPAPIPMLLFCPDCGMQHVDAPEPENDWTNPPHLSHKCHGCNLVWRPADVPTVGVLKIRTKGKGDSYRPGIS
jgi:NTP pyrophosphatase (non-canonical NTP hydrolase)